MTQQTARHPGFHRSGNQTRFDQLTSIRPLWLLGGLAVITAILLALLLINQRSVDTNTSRLHAKLNRIENIRGQILHLDEVLSMSARMTAATGDTIWEARYRENEPLLARLIDEAQALSASTGDAHGIAGAAAANERLAAMRNEAFALVRASRASDALHLLNSDDYVRESKHFASGMRRLDQALNRRYRANETLVAEHIRVHQGLAIIGVGIISACWLGILLTFRRWRQLLAKSHYDLANEQTLLREIISTIPYDVFWKDRKSVYLGCNREFARKAGLASGDDIVGRDDFELPWSREETEGYRADDAEVMSGGVPKLHIVETQQQTDGSTIHLDTSKVPLRDTDGAVIGVLGIYADVTDRVRMEQDLTEARRRAERANKAKSEFLANMSHEIRTPMTAILGFADLIAADENIQRDPKQMTDAIRTIQSNAGHLLTVIDDVLDVSKIEAGRMTVECIPTNVTRIVADVVALIAPRARQKQIGVLVTYESPIPTSILSDPIRLRQILLNLTGNAIKFTDHGDIGLHISCDRESRRMRFRIVDTGIGMTTEQVAAVSQFQAFTQADASTTRRFGGSGLGLRISNALARMLGGEITVESVYRRGSTFTITVECGDLAQVPFIEPNAIPEFLDPRAESLSPASSETTEPPRALAGARILLAEDGPDNQRLFQHILRKAGADVTVCDNGLEAVRAIETAKSEELPDLVLMDMQMPQLDGYDATRRLRDQGYSRPILALTAHAMEGDSAKCLDAGCDDYLAKPVNHAHLINCCARWRAAAQAERAAPPPRHGYAQATDTSALK